MLQSVKTQELNIYLYLMFNQLITIVEFTNNVKIKQQIGEKLRFNNQYCFIILTHKSTPPFHIGSGGS